MATTTNTKPDVSRLTTAAQNNVLTFSSSVLTAHKNQQEMQDKMDAIDVAYARYKAAEQEQQSDGVDRYRNTPCGDIFSSDEVVPPLVVSQVDSYTAYLADVFLSGYPLFPVVSNPSNKQYAEQLETLLDDHASLGGYTRQLLLFIRDGVKYNYSAVEAEWDAIDQFSVAGDFESGTGRKVDRKKKYFTRIKRLNMRNVVRDMTVPVGDVSESGDYAGYIEMISKTRLKRLLNKLTDSGEVYNADKAMLAATNDPNASSSISNNFVEDPVISNYITTSVRSSSGGVDWDVWFDGASPRRGAKYGTMYEKFVLYARIMPADFGISAPQRNTPQIWKFVIINGSVMISAKRIISAYDYLPILFGQPLEDGLGDQTQSVAEGEIPFQTAASTLFNIRFASARRAVSDRALYDPSFMDSADVNNKGAAPKIPVRIGALANKKLSDVYYPIPFDSRGLDNVIQDAQTVVSFSKELHGLNNARQGQFQKGNKSVTEWNDTMAGSDNRSRLPALVLENQFFMPLKSILVLNIFQYGEDTAVVSQKNGNVLKIDLTVLRQQVLAFRVADGATPKSKLASTEAITGIMQLISTSPILQQVYGTRLPGILAHLAQLQGVRGLDEYDPAFGQQAQAPQGLQQATIAPTQAASPLPNAVPPSTTSLPSSLP